jgi:transcriptional regulator with XRE-family HTH domain
MTEKVKTGERRPNEVDVHVGQRLRLRRKRLSISQEKLADALGLTFQQVQKYERGFNRISASKLYEAARFLHAPVTYFYEGLTKPEDEASAEGSAEPETPAFVYGFLADEDGAELASAFMKISRRKRRRVLVDLARELASEEDGAAAANGR